MNHPFPSGALARLEHIRARTPSPQSQNFPDFLVLGPQRTGSTWLHANLVRHPRLRLHRDKETFFFSTLGQSANPRFRYQFLEDYLDSFNERPSEILKKHYSCLRKCRRLYRPTLTGESTASYAVLGDAVIAEILALNPEMRAVLMIRHPYERAWSHAKKDLLRGRRDPCPERDFLDFLTSEPQVARADYSSMIARWSAHLRPGHLLILPFDLIEAKPCLLVQKVERFLGLPPMISPRSRHLSSRQNPTPGLDIPREFLPPIEDALGLHLSAYFDLREKVGDGLVV